jgi:hypothetical protein
MPADWLEGEMPWEPILLDLISIKPNSLQVLEKAEEYLQRGERWGCLPYHEGKMCLLAVINMAMLETLSPLHRAVDHLAKAIGGDCCPEQRVAKIIAFNDAPGRKWEEIEAILQKAKNIARNER